MTTTIPHTLKVGMTLCVASLLVACGALHATHANPTRSAVDDDLNRRGNRQWVVDNDISYRYYHYPINERMFTVAVFQKAPLGNTRYLVLHDSENAAFDAGLRAIADGGLLVALENNEHRNLYDQRHRTRLPIDPNRIFQTDNPYLPLAMHLLYALQLDNDSQLIALHNNSPNSAFGMDNLNHYGNTKPLCQNDGEPKNLYWFAVPSSPSKQEYTNNTPTLYQVLCQHPINLAIELAPSIADGDGSLSIYTTNKGMDYVNIEIKAGDKAGDKGDPQSEQHAMNEQLRYIHQLIGSTQ